MKKHVIIIGLLFVNAIGFGQNVFPVNGNVGIGTASPSKLLDVYGGTTTSAQIIDIAQFRVKSNLLQGAADNVFKVQHKTNAFLGGSCKLLMNYGGDLGFIEFPIPTVQANRPKVATIFGYNSSDLMEIWSDGKVKIGSTAMPAGYKLFVEQGILTEKVKVAIKATADWSDYVFASNYDLMPLSEVEAFTKENKHLPNVPSAEEMVENGLDVASMDAKLLEKIEELTLYLIEQKKEIEKLKTEVNTLTQKIK